MSLSSLYHASAPKALATAIDSYFWNYTSSYSDCTNVNYWYDLAEVAGVYIER